MLSLFWADRAEAGVLAERLAKFPQWQTKPPVQAVIGMEDLIYPDWIAGTWNVTSTLVDLVAPLAPEIVTPGFENNRRYLNQPIAFTVRFPVVSHNDFGFAIFNPKSKIQNLKSEGTVVADRSFNGLNIAKATLGDRAVLSVKTDPHNPNRQTTLLSGSLQLVSIVTSRASEITNANEFISTEVSQQLFRAPTIGMRPYFNEVETTTAYRKLETSDASIEADQVTAIYLSPQDPNYFVAADKPVALYRYRLEFFPASVPGG
ncbi:DUF6816 family protein [Aerosakkonema sp. BLCC-F183]|uniref:DUF6816 family protein n=1 Tax=Aerosakkonema sp. BLCC-F183 TaxID=3342834 RepID=UPI0035BC9468